MKPGEMITESWQLTKRNKFLWVFGFLAGLNTTGSQNGWETLIQGGGWIFQNLDELFTTINFGQWSVGLFALLFWSIGTNARISLILKTAFEHEDRTKGFFSLFKNSIRFIPKIIGFQFTVWLPLIILGLLTSLAIFPEESSFGNGGSFPTGGIGAISLIAIVVFFITLFLSFVDAFGYRAIVIKDLSIPAAIRHSFSFVNKNFGDIFSLCIGVVLVGLALGILMMIAFIPIMFSVLMGGMGGMGGFGSGGGLSSIFFTILGFGVLSSLFIAPWVATQSCAFTLCYLHFSPVEKLDSIEHLDDFEVDGTAEESADYSDSDTNSNLV